MKNKRTKHSAYNLNYHIVFVTKYRHQVLKDKIQDCVKIRMQELCKEYGWEMLALEVMPDHIHLFVSAEPKIAPLAIATTLKSILTVDIFKKFKTLKSKYFWDQVCSVEGVTMDQQAQFPQQLLNNT